MWLIVESDAEAVFQMVEGHLESLRRHGERLADFRETSWVKFGIVAADQIADVLQEIHQSRKEIKAVYDVRILEVAAMSACFGGVEEGVDEAAEFGQDFIPRRWKIVISSEGIGATIIPNNSEMLEAKLQSVVIHY